MIKDIPFVGYPVTDLAKAREFYEGLLGLIPSEEYGTESPWIEYNIGPTATFSIGKMDDWKPAKGQGPSAAFEVDNLEEMVSMLKEKGVEFTMDIQTFPSCSMAVCFDPDGNCVTLHQHK